MAWVTLPLLASSAKAAETRRVSTQSITGPACSNLAPLFGRGSYAFNPSLVAGGGFSVHLRGQFAQPRGEGNRSFNELNHSKDRVLETHLFEVNRFCFKSQVSPVLMLADKRFKHMSLNPPPAVLACIWLVTEVANGSRFRPTRLSQCWGRP